MRPITFSSLTEENLHSIGRLGKTRENAPVLFWTGSGVEFQLTGSNLSIEVTAQFQQYELWFDIIVDGALIERRRLQEGHQTITIFSHMNPDTPKTIRLLRDTQAMPEETSHIILQTIHMDGCFLPIKKRTHLIEVIGDSITSGEGLIGHYHLEDWVPYCFSATGSYAYQLGNLLDADVSILSQSGWGCAKSYDGDSKKTLPPYYTQVCGVLKNEEDQLLGSQNHWHNRRQPDAIVINLGTNDSNQQMFEGFDKFRVQFKNSVISFLELLRKENPTSYLLWTYGMLGDTLWPEITEAYELFSKHDLNCGILLLPDTVPSELGARLHPGPIAHERAAKLISEHLMKRIESFKK